LGSIHAREAIGGGAEQVIPSIPVEDWNAAVALLEDFAHVLREEVVTVVLLGVFVEQAVVNVDEFPAVGRGDLVKIADDPTDRLEVPVVGEPDKAVVGGDVRREGELTAAEGAEVALAKFRPPARPSGACNLGFQLSF